MHIPSSEAPEAPSEPIDLSVPGGDFGEGFSSDMHENCPCSETRIHHYDGQIYQRLKINRQYKALQNSTLRSTKGS
jgi:hypothetical protein